MTLNFGDQPEPLYIPYDAILTFVDPSVEFGLRFESTEMEDLSEDEEDDHVEEEDAPKQGDVVSLDSFRKS